MVMAGQRLAARTLPLSSVFSCRLLDTRHLLNKFQITLDDSTLYVMQNLAEALGWHSTNGISFRLNGWEPSYFDITQTGTVAGKQAIGKDRLARILTRGDSRSSCSWNGREQLQSAGAEEVLEYLKKSDSEAP